MKKALGFFLTAIAATMILSGCVDSKVEHHDWSRLVLIERYKDFDVYADVETGVEYFVGQYQITPILNADGKPSIAPNFDAYEPEDYE